MEDLLIKFFFFCSYFKKDVAVWSIANYKEKRKKEKQHFRHKKREWKRRERGLDNYPTEISKPGAPSCKNENGNLVTES